jgi:hypothetical protein
VAQAASSRSRRAGPTSTSASVIELPVCGVEQRVPCPSVQRIPLVEGGDQETGVDDDHAGQSPRSRLSSLAPVSASLVRRIAVCRRAVLLVPVAIDDLTSLLDEP